MEGFVSLLAHLLVAAICADNHLFGMAAWIFETDCLCVLWLLTAATSSVGLQHQQQGFKEQGFGQFPVRKKA